jgi:ELWxxDGT repeat protein
MKKIFTLIAIFVAQFTNAQNPVIVKTVSSTVTEPEYKDQLYWENNEWNGLFFYQGKGTPSKLCITDGTTAGTQYVTDIGSGQLTFTIPAQDFMYLIVINTISVSPAITETTLWKSDATAAGTSLIYTFPQIMGVATSHNFKSNNRSQNFSLIGNVMIFGAYDAANGIELWKTDGTAAGTSLLKDIKPGVGNSTPAAFCKIGNEMFFSAMQTGFERKLWKTDGTTAGTVQVPVSEPFFISDFAVGKINNKMTFFATNTADGYEPYVSDGTPGGTVMLKNINATSNQSGNGSPTSAQATEWDFNNKHCYFIAYNGTANALWRTDGTNAGTIQLTASADNVSSITSTSTYTDIDSNCLWMLQHSTIGNSKLYKSDGTVAGTYLVKQGLNLPNYIKPYKNSCWFSGRPSGTNFNTEPWRSGGNAATTNMAFDIAPGAPPGAPTFLYPSNPYGFFVKNNKLYFFASTAAPTTHNLYQYTGDFTFNGNLAGGNWKDSANWNSMMPPGITDSVYVNAGTPNALNIATGNAYAGTLLLGNNAVVNIATSTDSIIVNTRIAAAGNNNFTGNGVVALRNIAADTVEINNGFSAANLALQSHASAAAGTVSVNNNLNLTNNSQLMVNNSSIVLAGSTSTITQTGNSYLNTNGTGKLTIENIGATGRASAVTFPVGTSSYYNPVIFTNAGVMDNFSLRVQPQIFAAYTGENGIGVYSANAVNATWFITEANAGGSNANIVLQWDALQELPGFDRSISRFGHYNSGWQLSTPSTAAGSNPYTFNGTGITSFSPFGILNNAGALPLRFISFTAQKCNSNNVCLNWHTASEINVSHFIVERSLDGQLYTPVTTVAAQNGLTNNYVFTDDIALLQYSSKIYYRIKQTDADGKSSFSNVQVIKADINKIEIYPNPVADRLYFANWQQIKTIQLFSADGKLLQVVFSNQNYIDVKTLPNGTYFIKTTSKQNETGMYSFIKR